MTESILAFVISELLSHVNLLIKNKSQISYKDYSQLSSFVNIKSSVYLKNIVSLHIFSDFSQTILTKQ